MVVLGVSAVVAAAVVVPIELTGSPRTGNSAAPPVTGADVPTHGCASSGCAVIQTVRTNPRTVVFYGASCSGVHGQWFLNVTEGGADTVPKPSYALSWSFVGRIAKADPDGEVAVTPENSGVKMSLTHGALTISGPTANGGPVSATGRLRVALTGSQSKPELVITETGLSNVESALGVVSPFDVNGAPAVLRISTVRTLAEC